MVASEIMDTFIEYDAKEMLRMVEEVFGQLAEDYLLNKPEAESVIEGFKQLDMPEILRDMYASKDRSAFAQQIMEPLVEHQARNRGLIQLPSEVKLLEETGNIIGELAPA